MLKYVIELFLNDTITNQLMHIGYGYMRIESVIEDDPDRLLQCDVLYQILQYRMQTSFSQGGGCQSV